MLKARIGKELDRWRRVTAAVASGRGGPDAVHRLRVVSRRCREGFRLLDYKSDALSEFNHSLGALRDVEMLCQRLKAKRDPSLDSRLILKVFEKRRKVLTRKLMQRLRSSIPTHLGKVLEAHLKNVSLTPEQEAMLAHRALKKAVRRLHRLWKRRPEHPKRSYLHRLRRAIRRLRFVSELLAPLNAKELERLAARAVHWQKRLGQYQDAVIAQKIISPVPGGAARRLVKEARATEKRDGSRFWNKWRDGGWRKLRRHTQEALDALA